MTLGLRFPHCLRASHAPSWLSPRHRRVPAKAKTLEKFLGKDFKVLASYGHVRDLPRKGLGVDRDNSYEPTYEVLDGKEKTHQRAEEGGRRRPTRSTSRPTPTARARRSPGTFSRPSQPGEGQDRSSACASTRSPRRPCSRRWQHAGEIDSPARRRAAGAAHHRPARRLRGVGPALEEGLAGPLRRPGPDGGAADQAIRTLNQ